MSESDVMLEFRINNCAEALIPLLDLPGMSCRHDVARRATLQLADMIEQALSDGAAHQEALLVLPRSGEEPGTGSERN